MSNAPDELFTVKNHFYLGNYQRAVHEGNSFKAGSEELQAACDTYVLRSYVAMGKYETVLEEIAATDDAPIGVQAVGLHAKYMLQPSKGESILQQLSEHLTDVATANDKTLRLTASILHLAASDYKSALRALGRPTDLEQMALLVQIYLQMNLLERAFKQLQAMQKIDDDSTLTQLALGWVNLAMGGSKYQEAAYVFQELIDKYGATVRLLNGLAVAAMHLGNYSEARESLVDALSKDNNDADTLVNMCACLQFLNKTIQPNPMMRYVRDLRKARPSHPWLKQFDAMNTAFEDACSK